MYGANSYIESLSKSQAGIQRKVKLGPYILPMLVMVKDYLAFLRRLIICPATTIRSAIKNIELPITFACAGIPRAADT